MVRTAGRTWLRRGFLGVGLILAAAGTWASLNYSSLKCRYAVHKFKAATNDADRARWADELIARGDEGQARLLDLLSADDPSLSSAAAAAVERHLTQLPDSDPRLVTFSNDVLAAFPRSSASGRRGVLTLIPILLKRNSVVDALQCRAVVEAGLVMPAPEDRVLAIRLAMHPTIKLRAEVVPLLNAPEADVRRAALFAVGPATDDEPVIGDEDLFRWLHDPDDGVRQVCFDALVSRGRTEAEISLGRRLAHPEPFERLQLLLDLRYDDDVVDPEPWLERLSRDPDPAVRAGAARVAVEVAAERHVPTPIWVGRLADTDPYLAVRQVAGYFRTQPTMNSPTGPVQPAGGNSLKP